MPAHQVWDLWYPNAAAQGLPFARGRLDATGTPIRFYGTPWEVTRHPPMQGEHTREVLGELGYAKGDVDALIGEGLVADVNEMRRMREKRRARKVE